MVMENSPKGIDDALLAGVEIKRLSGKQVSNFVDDLTTQHNIATWETETPLPLRRTVPPATPFPIAALGEILSPPALRLHEVIQAPLALCAQSILAATTLAVQAFADVSIDGRNYPLSENFLTIGESGERKSAVDREVSRAARLRQRELSDVHQAELLKYRNEIDAYEKARDKILNDKKKTKEEMGRALMELGKPPEEPLGPLLIMEEPTYEGLVKQLDKGQPSIGLFSDEGGRLIGGHGMNQDNQLKTATGLCELWDGKEISRVRSGDGVMLLYGKRLSMHLMVQPTVAQQLLENSVLAGQGYLSRCLITYPESTVGSRTYNDADLSQDPVMLRYQSRLLSIFHTRPMTEEQKPNQLNPRLLAVSGPAKTLWVEFYNSIEKELASNGSYRDIRALGSKMAEHALRLAGALTLVKNLTALTVDLLEMDCGIALARYYLDESLRLRSMASATPELQMAETLLSWLQGRSERLIPLHDIYQRGPSAVRDAKTARKMMQVLAEHHWVREVKVGKNVLWEIRRVAC